MKTLLEKLDQFPPFLIRLCARRGRKAMTDRQLAAASGLSTNTVFRISHRSSWESISIGAASRFITASGVDILRPRRLKEFVKRGKFSHLKPLDLNRYAAHFANREED